MVMVPALEAAAAAAYIALTANHIQRVCQGTAPASTQTHGILTFTLNANGACVPAASCAPPPLAAWRARASWTGWLPASASRQGPVCPFACAHVVPGAREYLHVHLVLCGRGGVEDVAEPGVHCPGRKDISQRPPGARDQGWAGSIQGQPDSLFPLPLKPPLTSSSPPMPLDTTNVHIHNQH